MTTTGSIVRRLETGRLDTPEGRVWGRYELLLAIAEGWHDPFLGWVRAAAIDSGKVDIPSK